MKCHKQFMPSICVKHSAMKNISFGYTDGTLWNLYFYYIETITTLNYNQYVHHVLLDDILNEFSIPKNVWKKIFLRNHLFFLQMEKYISYQINTWFYGFSTEFGIFGSFLWSCHDFRMQVAEIQSYLIELLPHNNNTGNFCWL